MLSKNFEQSLVPYRKLIEIKKGSIKNMPPAVHKHHLFYVEVIPKYHMSSILAADGIAYLFKI